MKLNAKKFLSTLCVLASVSGVFAPNLVNASSTHEEYGVDFPSAPTPNSACGECSGDVSDADTSDFTPEECGEGVSDAVTPDSTDQKCSEGVLDAVTPNIPGFVLDTPIPAVSDSIADSIISLMRKRNHQALYDEVMKYVKNGQLHKFHAFMVIELDQLIKLGKKNDEWIFSNSEIKDAITTGNWKKYDKKSLAIIENIKYTFKYAINRGNDLEVRAGRIFKIKYAACYFSRDWKNTKLEESLEKLNPSNPKGLVFGGKIYSKCLDKDSPSDKDGSPVKVRQPIEIILSHLRNENHQECYDVVIALMNEKLITEPEAFMYIIFNQTIQNAEYKDIYEYFESTSYYCFYHLKLCCDKLYELVERCHGVATSGDYLERRATDLFFKLYSHERERKFFIYTDKDRISDEQKEVIKDLEKALEELNPSNTEGLA